MLILLWLLVIVLWNGILTLPHVAHYPSAMPLRAHTEAQLGSLCRMPPFIQAQSFHAHLAEAKLKSLPGALYPSAMLVNTLKKL